MRTVERGRKGHSSNSLNKAPGEGLGDPEILPAMPQRVGGQPRDSPEPRSRRDTTRQLGPDPSSGRHGLERACEGGGSP